MVGQIIGAGPWVWTEAHDCFVYTYRFANGYQDIHYSDKGVQTWPTGTPNPRQLPTSLVHPAVSALPPAYPGHTYNSRSLRQIEQQLQQQQLVPYTPPQDDYRHESMQLTPYTTPHDTQRQSLRRTTFQTSDTTTISYKDGPQEFTMALESESSHDFVLETERKEYTTRIHVSRERGRSGRRYC